MNAIERQLRIQEMLEAQDFVDLRTLRYRLRASEATLRRDLAKLERKGAIKRVHGGATRAEEQSELRYFPALKTPVVKEKRSIAALAATLVEDGQTVILDGGTTVAQVARNLLGRNIQIITNSVTIAGIFYDSPTCEVTLTGGYLYPRLGVLLGPLCEQVLGSIKADLLIMSVAGITERGISNENTLVVNSEKKMIEVSAKVVIVADHTKFGRDAMAYISPIEEADVVITDRGIAPEHLKIVEQRGVKVMLA